MRAKEFINENDTIEKPTKQKPRIIEYEDMTPFQQKIVDISMSPDEGTFPKGLSDVEMQQWILDKITNG